ncbi:right-handed parallel beta-helix repeat-containing protein, partial [Candidatus Bipolaricaulota bacterium]|nr:right-handed parallel beta-helix repeat-containing protein [Candidatus Bipolaricaulota bacterium]
MKSYTVCLVMLVAVVAVNVFAAAIQEVSGTLQQDKTWSETIRVTGDVYVPPGCTLTILPGTVIRFAVRSDSVNHSLGQFNCPAPKAELIVEGTLKAQGTETKPILFTSDSATPSPGDWGGIIFHGRATPVTLSYLVIEYADVNLMTFPSDIVIENCIIRNAYGGLDDCPTSNHWDVRTGIFLHGERSIVRNCEIANCTWGFHINQGNRTEAAIHIENCHIHDNNVTSPGFDVPNGIHVYKSNVHIEGNTIENNEWGIEIGISNVVIIDNAFISNDFGVVIYSPDGPSEGYVHGNDVFDNGMDYVRMTPAGAKPMPEDWFQDPYDTSGDSPNAANSDTAFTRIVIDGRADDWSDYPILRVDGQGDTRNGGFDLKSVQAFTNDQHLYLLLDAYGDIGEYVQIDLDIDVNGDGNQDYMATFRPRTGRRDFGDFTSSQGSWNSMEGGDAAEGEVVELKMPLGLIGSCESFTLMNIRVMNGTCCGEQWYMVDNMGPAYVARSDEIELPGSALAATFDLLPGY